MRVDTGYKSFATGEALAIHRLVKMSGSTANTVVYADGSSDLIVGSTNEAAATSSAVSVKLLGNSAGTLTCVASEAISIHTLVYPDVDGKVTDAGLSAIGLALQAATADGDHIEVLPIAQASAGTLGQSAHASVHEIFSDFDYYVSTDLFTTVATNSGTAAVSDGVNGQLLLSPSDGSVVDNDETYCSQTTESFLLAANKPLYWESRVAITEAATNTANMMVGVKDAWAADSILDDGAGPPASYSGIVVYKVDGGTTFLAEASIAGTQTTITLTSTTATTGTFFVLAAEFLPTSATASTLNIYIDGTLVGTASFTFTSATEMEMGCGVKGGADTTHDKVTCDYMFCRQTR